MQVAELGVEDLLAFVNLAFGFCLGCFLYLHLRYARALFTGK